MIEATSYAMPTEACSSGEPARKRMKLDRPAPRPAPTILHHVPGQESTYESASNAAVDTITRNKEAHEQREQPLITRTKPAISLHAENKLKPLTYSWNLSNDLRTKFGIDASLSVLNNPDVVSHLTAHIILTGDMREAPVLQPQPKPEPRPIPKLAHAVWLFRKSDFLMRRAHRANILGFAELNPSWTVTIWTDDIRRVRIGLTLHELKSRKRAQANLHVRDYRDGLPAHEFSVAKNYVHAVREHIPASAKDLLSYMLLDGKSGLFFDADIHWLEPLPDPMVVSKKIASAGFENQLFAVSANVHCMKALLTACEHAIENHMKIEMLPDASVKFTLKHGEDFKLEDIVNEVGFYPFINTLYDHGSVDLHENISYKRAAAQGSWIQQGVGLRDIVAVADCSAIPPQEVPELRNLSAGDLIALAAPKDMSVHEVPKRAHFSWFHKQDPRTKAMERSLTEQEATNILWFRRMNPHWKITVWTDDVERINSLLQLHSEESLASKIGVADYRKIFSDGSRVIASEYIHALISQVPAFAKDVFVPAVLEKFGGLAADVDVRWRSPLPVTLTMPNAVHLNENVPQELSHDIQVIASADPSVSNAMTKVMDVIEHEIQSRLTRTDLHDGTIEFQARNNTGFMSDDLHYHIGIVPLLQVVQDAPHDIHLDEILDFIPTESEHAWEDEGQNISRLISPNMRRRSMSQANA